MMLYVLGREVTHRGGSAHFLAVTEWILAAVNSSFETFSFNARSGN